MPGGQETAGPTAGNGAAAAAVILWASVSAEVDQRLSETAKLLEGLREKSFKNEPVKVRVLGTDSKQQVRVLGSASQPAGAGT